MKRLLLITFTFWTTSSAFAIDEFSESFDGQGPYATIDGRVEGFDNPDWSLAGDGTFENGGLLIESILEPGQERTGNTLFREVLGNGSFTSTLVVRQPTLTVSPIGGSAIISLEHVFDVGNGGRNGVLFWVLESDQNLDDWRVGMASSEELLSTMVPSGNQFEMAIAFDSGSSTVSFLYDDDVSDDVPPSELANLRYPGSVGDVQREIAMVNADSGRAIATLDHWSLTTNVGDFNNDGVLDVADLDLLTSAIHNGAFDETLDLNGDGSLDEFDRTIWVKDRARTWFGDTNLDGEFSSGDLVAVFQAGEYEDGFAGNSTWSTGDWNGDGDFNTRDLVLAFQDGGYDTGARSDAAPIPEPDLLFPSVVAFLVILITKRR